VDYWIGRTIAVGARYRYKYNEPFPLDRSAEKPYWTFLLFVFIGGWI
jgi:hypothetical protein